MGHLESRRQPNSRRFVQLEHILTEDTDLNQGFEIIEEFVGVNIPVVENTKTQRLTGIIHEANIIQAYNEAVKTARGENKASITFAKNSPKRLTAMHKIVRLRNILTQAGHCTQNIVANTCK